MLLTEAVFLLAFVGLVKAQVGGFGSCPEIAGQSVALNSSRFAGVWYEYEKYFYIPEIGSTCVSRNYKLKADKTYETVTTQTNSITGYTQDIVGSARFVPSTTFNVSFPVLIGDREEILLGTDYSEYAILYSCKETLGVLNYKLLWVLTRLKAPTTITVEKVNQILTKYDVSKMLLFKTLQNC